MKPKKLDASGLQHAWDVIKGYIDSVFASVNNSAVKDVKYFLTRGGVNFQTEILPYLDIGDYFAREEGGDVVAFRVTATSNGGKSYEQDMDNSAIYLFPTTPDTFNVWGKAIYVAGNNGLNPV